MPVKIKKIVSYKQDHPTATLADIGARFKVSRQYIYKVLKKQNISTSLTSSFDPRRTIKRHVRYCLVCGEVSTRKVCLGKCHFSYYNIKINCAFCFIPFYRKRAKIIGNYTRGYKLNYCSRFCYYKGQRNPVIVPSGTLPLL